MCAVPKPDQVGSSDPEQSVAGQLSRKGRRNIPPKFGRFTRPQGFYVITLEAFHIVYAEFIRDRIPKLDAGTLEDFGATGKMKGWADRGPAHTPGHIMGSSMSRIRRHLG